MAIYSLAEETHELPYALLLEEALQFCVYGIVVVHNDEPISTNCKKILERIIQFGARIRESDHWPGTILLSGSANLYEFDYSKQIVEYLKEVTNSFFSWRSPDFPEDLCLLRNDRTPWLVTIAHETDCYFQLNPDEARNLQLKFPQLRTLELKLG